MSNTTDSVTYFLLVLLFLFLSSQTMNLLINTLVYEISENAQHDVLTERMRKVCTFNMAVLAFFCLTTYVNY